MTATLTGFTGSDDVVTIDYVGENDEYKVNRLAAKSLFKLKAKELNCPFVESMQENAKIFPRIPKVESVSMPLLEKVGKDAFRTCKRLNSIDMPSVTEIGDDAFYGTPLTEVSMQSVITVGDEAFRECKGLTSVDLPKATAIGASAFQRCTALTEIHLPEAVTVGCYAFMDCTSLKEVTLEKASVLEYYCFSDSTSLETVNLPVARTIYQDSFRGCTSLVDVDMPCVVTIESYAFSGCPIKEICLPGTLTYVGTCAFAGGELGNRKLIMCNGAEGRELELDQDLFHHDDNPLNLDIICMGDVQLTESNCKDWWLMEIVDDNDLGVGDSYNIVTGEKKSGNGHYIISFDADGGSHTKSIVSEPGVPLTPPGEPTRKGMTFAGWTQIVGSNPGTPLPAAMPSENACYRAVWLSSFEVQDRLSLKEGSSASVPLHVQPDGTDILPRWTSSDEKVATVDSRGNVTALRSGVTDVTAVFKGFTDVCHVAVYTESDSMEYVSDDNDIGTVPPAAVDRIIDDGASLEVATGTGRVVFPPESLSTETYAGSSSVTVCLKETETPPIYETLVGDGKTVEVYLEVDGVRVETDFGTNVTLKVRYDLREGGDPAYIKVYYLDTSGTETVVEDSRYTVEDGLGYVSFETIHFSEYAVVYAEPQPAPAEDPPVPPFVLDPDWGRPEVPVIVLPVPVMPETVHEEDEEDRETVLAVAVSAVAVALTAMYAVFRKN